jgi:integrase
VPLPVIQQRLGHKSIKITVDVYGGLLVQTHEVADAAIARALSGQRVVPLVTASTGQHAAAG